MHRPTHLRSEFFAVVVAMGMSAPFALAQQPNVGPSPPAKQVEIVHRHAIVVGSNIAPSEQKLKTLEFADDDALNNCELLRELGMEVDLFTEPDPTTWKRYGLQEKPPPVDKTSPPAVYCAGRRKLPNRAMVKAAIDRVVEAVTHQKDGETHEIYFWFSGHGNGQALFLQDGLLTTEEIKDWLLGPTRNGANVHLILDACGTLQFVAGRDGKPIRLSQKNRDATRAAMGLDLAQNTHVGAFIGTTAARKVHEWDRIEGGILSYELRSALRSAADAGHDGRIVYSEADAFVWVANLGVEDPDVRMDGIAFRPHSGLDATLADWSGSHTNSHLTLLIPGAQDVRLWIADSRGVRIAETHAGQDSQSARIFLPIGREYSVNVLPTDGQPGGVFSIAADQTGEVALNQLKPASDLSSRGDPDAALKKGLFREPFGPPSYKWISQARQQDRNSSWAFVGRGEEEDPPAAGIPTGTYVLGGLALGAGTFGLVSHLVANSKYDAWQAAAPGSEERERAKSATENWDTARNISFGVGAAALLGAGAWWLWGRPSTLITVGRVQPILAPTAAGAVLRF